MHVCLCIVNTAAYYSSWAERYASYSPTMYPFGLTYCDSNATINQKSSGLNADINFTLPFYGSRYKSILVSGEHCV